MTILEGESLLNDAAGIISFKIAVGVLITGTFSILMRFNNFDCLYWRCYCWSNYRHGFSEISFNINETWH